ncbi:MAG TPA: hypothetical protein VFS13_12520 [Steroidobacteraceae bacterium]|jgi:hypothetical protein|nr:hypothetical protein [Steroidobacteraceae bacterium]
MQTLQVALTSILGFTLCLAMLNIASQARMRWHRVVLALLAAFGLMSQGTLWAYITYMLKTLSVGGSYLWLYAALLTSVAGTVWALVLLGKSFGRRFTG